MPCYLSSSNKFYFPENKDTAITLTQRYLKNAHPAARLLYETESAPLDTNNNGLEPWSPPSKEAIDLVIALGGDGTILRASSLFKTGPVPPVLSFSMGTLGFLLPFR